MQLAEKAQFDEAYYAQTIVQIARRLQRAGREDEALAVLDNAARHVSGDPAGLVLIEAAKIWQSRGDWRQALSLFQRALTTTVDPAMRAWVRDTLEDLDRQKSNIDGLSLR